MTVAWNTRAALVDHTTAADQVQAAWSLLERWLGNYDAPQHDEEWPLYRAVFRAWQLLPDAWAEDVTIASAVSGLTPLHVVQSISEVRNVLGEIRFADIVDDRHDPVAWEMDAEAIVHVLTALDNAIRALGFVARA